MEREAVRHETFFHKIQRKRFYHFADDNFRFRTVIRAAQHLATANAMRFGFVPFDFSDAAGFVTPCMVN